MSGLDRRLRRLRVLTLVVRQTMVVAGTFVQIDRHSPFWLQRYSCIALQWLWSVLFIRRRRRTYLYLFQFTNLRVQ